MCRCGYTPGLLAFLTPTEAYTGSVSPERSLMGISQITLTNYDTVVAVTQNSINETLAVYLDSLQKQVSLYYDVDKSGNFVLAKDCSFANYIFTGTLDYTLDVNGNLIDIVKLYSGKGA